MTELIIDFPGEIRIDELEIKTRLEIPEIPAEKITGVLHPDQIPLGVIPDLEGVVQIQDELTGLTARVLTLEEAETVTPAQFSTHVETTGSGGHIPPFGLTDAHIANGAAIAPSKLDLPSLYDVLNIESLTTETEVVQLFAPHISTYGLGGHIPMTGLTNSHIAEGAAIGPDKLDMVALEEALDLSGGEGGNSGGSPALGELLYTVFQSANYNGMASLAGTYANLTDGSASTGAGTANAGSTGIPQWIQFDVGQLSFINEVWLSGGTLPSFGTTPSFLNGLPLQASRDGTNWFSFATIQGTTSAFLLIGFAAGFWARYIRIFSTTSWIGLAECRIIGE